MLGNSTHIKGFVLRINIKGSISTFLLYHFCTKQNLASQAEKADSYPHYLTTIFQAF